MMYRIALPMIALVVAGGCGGRDATGPSVTAVASFSRVSEQSGRGGYIHIVKTCNDYTGLAGSFCILTSSNLKQIPAGTKVVYAKGVSGTTLDTDITLYPPGRGKSVAYGHVVLNLVTKTGVATLNGGTGPFKHFSARVDIAYLYGRSWSWEGPYSFGKGDDEGED